MGTATTQHSSDEAIPTVPQTSCASDSSCSGSIKEDSAYYLTDANVGILGGEIAMDYIGNLRLSPNGGWLLETGPPHRWCSDDMGSMPCVGGSNKYNLTLHREV